VILGFFAIGWFQWAQAVPPRGLGTWLDAGSVLAALVAVAGLVVVIRSPRRPDRGASVGRRYGLIVGVEFAVALAGSVLLGTTGHAAYVPVLVAAVVGLHFPFLAPVLGDRLLVPLGVVVTAIAAAAAVQGLTTGAAPVTLAAGGSALALLAYAVLALVRAWRTQ
jgi:hypothetical protein